MYKTLSLLNYLEELACDIVDDDEEANSRTPQYEKTRGRKFVGQENALHQIYFLLVLVCLVILGILLCLLEELVLSALDLIDDIIDNFRDEDENIPNIVALMKECFKVDVFRFV